MNGILILVLSVALGQFPDSALHEREAAFAELAPECAAEYDRELREFRKTSATTVCRCDLDGDGTEELLVWTGESGSGGEGWIVMRKEKGTYRKAGEVFGILHKSGRGLIVESPCGWSYADWSYYELIGGALVRKLDVEVEYGNPIRREPVRIKVEARVSEHRDR